MGISISTTGGALRRLGGADAQGGGRWCEGREAEGSAHGCEGATVDWAGTVAPKRGDVLANGVALVPLETVARVLILVLAHACIALGFREDRSGGDGQAALVALDDARLLDRHLVQLTRVDQQVLGGHVQRLDGAPHRRDSGPIDVQLVDFFWLDECDSPGACFALDERSQLNPPLRQHLLGIVDTRRTPLWLE